MCHRSQHACIIPSRYLPVRFELGSCVPYLSFGGATLTRRRLFSPVVFLSGGPATHLSKGTRIPAIPTPASTGASTWSSTHPSHSKSLRRHLTLFTCHVAPCAELTEHLARWAWTFIATGASQQDPDDLRTTTELFLLT